ncbi:MAG: sensor domain-containing diguanylate cyclase [Alphaproteobacteria bacterium]|nr:sensor domain-containing diguanylate cyclase [Alphaproteobacteria bacterium]
MLQGYPGVAVLMARDGTVLAANSKGAGLKALLGRNSLPDLAALIERAHADEAIAVGVVTLASQQGDVVLEATVLPGTGTRTGATAPTAVLTRDLTMERNLRTALVESRQRYKDLVDMSSDFAWETGADGAFAFVSPQGALGYRADEIVGRPAVEFISNPEDFSPLPFLSERDLNNVEIWMRREDGRISCVQLSARALFDEVGQWRGARGICRDMTEDRDRESALARARQRDQLLGYIVSTVRDEVDPANMLAAAASATGRALGATGCRIYHRGVDDRLKIGAHHGGEAPRGLDAAAEACTGDQGVETTQVMDDLVLVAPTHYRHTINGVLTMWRPSGRGDWDDDHRLLLGDVANQLGIANEQLANHERIVMLSLTDGMTGLLNRRAFFEEELPRRFERLQRNNQSAALFYIDMDNFKRVNDTHGHQTGDEAIMALRDLMREYSRPGDEIARLGGDEFAMWLDNISAAAATRRAATLIEASQGLKRFSGDAEHPLGISVGVALFDPATHEALDHLIGRADEAMYAIKRAGKGGFHIAPSPPVKPASS